MRLTKYDRSYSFYNKRVKWAKNSSVVNTSQTKYGWSAVINMMSMMMPNIGRTSEVSSATTHSFVYFVPCNCIYVTCRIYTIWYNTCIMMFVHTCVFQILHLLMGKPEEEIHCTLIHSLCMDNLKYKYWNSVEQLIYTFCCF